MNFELTEKGKKMFPGGILKMRTKYWGLFIAYAGEMDTLSIATNACEIHALFEMEIIQHRKIIGDSVFEELNKSMIHTSEENL